MKSFLPYVIIVYMGWEGWNSVPFVARRQGKKVLAVGGRAKPNQSLNLPGERIILQLTIERIN